MTSCETKTTIKAWVRKSPPCLVIDKAKYKTGGNEDGSNYYTEVLEIYVQIGDGPIWRGDVGGNYWIEGSAVRGYSLLRETDLQANEWPQSADIGDKEEVEAVPQDAEEYKIGDGPIWRDEDEDEHDIVLRIAEEVGLPEPTYRLKYEPKVKGREEEGGEA